MDVVIILFTAIIAYVIDGLGTRLQHTGQLSLADICTVSELPLGCLQPLQWSLGSHLLQRVAARGELVLDHALIDHRVKT